MPTRPELGAGGGGAVDVDAIGHTGSVLAAQAHDLPASRFLIEPRQTTDLAIAPKRYRGRVAAHHDRALALGRKQPRRGIPIAMANPEQVIGQLYGEHLLQQLAIGIDRLPLPSPQSTPCSSKNARAASV